jgi:hypothetical protein
VVFRLTHRLTADYEAGAEAPHGNEGDVSSDKDGLKSCFWRLGAGYVVNAPGDFMLGVFRRSEYQKEKRSWLFSLTTSDLGSSSEFQPSSPLRCNARKCAVQLQRIVPLSLSSLPERAYEKQQN